jgi:hypothetical protein
VDEQSRKERTEGGHIAADTTVVASPNQVSTSVGDEAVILGATAGQYFGLSEVGARVWAMLQTPRTVAELCTTICAEYDVTPTECEEDVIDLLNELLAKGLIDVRSPARDS